MGSCYTGDHTDRDHIHLDITTCYINESQLKYRLETAFPCKMAGKHGNEPIHLKVYGCTFMSSFHFYRRSNFRNFLFLRPFTGKYLLLGKENIFL